MTIREITKKCISTNLKLTWIGSIVSPSKNYLSYNFKHCTGRVLSIKETESINSLYKQEELNTDGFLDVFYSTWWSNNSLHLFQKLKRVNNYNSMKQQNIKQRQIYYRKLETNLFIDIKILKNINKLMCKKNDRYDQV